jgi:hypothetical protein
MSRLVASALVVWLTGVSDVVAQSTDEPNPTALPVSLERIRKSLDREPAIRTEPTSSTQPTFRTRVDERLPAPMPLFTPRDVWVGIQPPGPTSHYEFLRMVTPVTARPYAAFSQTELAIVAAETMANAAIVYAAKAAIKSARSSARKRHVERLRHQIATEVAAIEAANAGCPAPDKVLPNGQHTTMPATPSSACH